MKRTFNWKVSAVVISLIIVSLSYETYAPYVLNVTKYLLTNSFFFYSIASISFIITIVHKYRNGVGIETFNQTKNTKEALTDIISTITEPSALVCSLSIIKGLFLDYFFDDTFFIKFQTSEKVFMLIVSISFFIHSLIEIRKFSVELFYKIEPIETIR